MFNHEKNQIASLKKLQELLLAPKLIAQTVNSDFFYERFSNSLDQIANIDKSHFIIIFNKLKLSSATSFEECALLYQLSLNKEFMNHLHHIFDNSTVLMQYILDTLMQNTVKHNIDLII